MKYPFLISMIHIALKELRLGVFCDSGVKKGFFSVHVWQLYGFHKHYWQGNLMRFCRTAAVVDMLGPEKGRSLQMLIWSFCLLTILLLLCYANRGFSVPFLTWEKAGLQVSLIPESEMCSILFFCCTHFCTATRFASTGMGNIAHSVEWVLSSLGW